MEGLRGIAVFLVFWVHYSSLAEPWLTGYSVPVSTFIHGFGHLGVDLFFVLSGYLIYGSIIDKPTLAAARYGKRRALRIYPTFLVVFAAYIALSFVFPSESKLPEGITNKLVYILQNLLLLPGLFDINPIITVAWSLSYEVFYYLAIPCLILPLQMKKWRVEVRIVAWSAVLVAGFASFAIFGGPVRLMMFIAGILLYELYAKKGVSLGGWGTTFLVLGLAVFGLRTLTDIHRLVLKRRMKQAPVQVWHAR